MTDNTWQERVVDEKNALDMKIERLQNYLHATVRPDAEGSLLTEQLEVMLRYSRILEKRIHQFH